MKKLFLLTILLTGFVRCNSDNNETGEEDTTINDSKNIQSLFGVWRQLSSVSTNGEVEISNFVGDENCSPTLELRPDNTYTDNLSFRSPEGDGVCIDDGSENGTFEIEDNDIIYDSSRVFQFELMNGRLVLTSTFTSSNSRNETVQAQQIDTYVLLNSL